MSSIKSGSKPISPLAHPVYPQKPSKDHFQRDQAAMTRKRSKVQSALYSTLKHMSVSCGAAVHSEFTSDAPLSHPFFQRPDANHTCFFLKGPAQGSLNFTNKLKLGSLPGEMDRQNQDPGSSKPAQVQYRYTHCTKLLLISLFILLQDRDFASHFLILHS